MDKQARQDFLADLLKIDTIGGHEDRVALFLKQAFAAHQIKGELLPVVPAEDGRHIFYAKVGNGNGPTLAFSGHQDVVSIGDIGKWTTDPLGAEVKDGLMYGRGASDMKSGLAGMAIAMLELADEHYLVNGKLLFMGTVGEESSIKNHMQGAQTLAKQGYTDHIDALIIGEPSNGDVVFATKGSILYKVTSKGIAAHSSTPEAGYNAIAPLIAYYNEQAKYFAKMTQIDADLGTTTPVVSKIDGGGQLNSVPDYAELYVKIRTIPALTNQSILKHVQQLINKINRDYQASLSLVVLGDKLPVKTDANDTFIEMLQQIGSAGFQREVKLKGISADTDASELTKFKPDIKVGVFGPGNNSIHKPDENVDLNQYDKFIDIYKQIVKHYFN